ncbi:MAG: YihY family inner membrane protein [Phycisphaerales bacterium]|nr:YihY family inner membrane protein [Phycisphaerales bacterium]
MNTPSPKTAPVPQAIRRVVEERKNIQRAAEAVRSGLNQLYRSQIPRMAAALAYRTIFGIVPVLVIALVVVGAIVPEQKMEQGINDLLEFTGLSEIVIEPPPDIVPTDSRDPSADPTQSNPDEWMQTQQAAQFAESQTRRLEDWIADLIQRIRNVPKAAIGFASALILTYAAISMLVEIERAFNLIYRCVIGRNWWSRITLYWTILTLGTILLGATFLVGQQFRHWVVSVEDAGVLSWIRVNILGYLATVLISTLLLTIAYSRIPNTRVQFRPALVGALVAAILWEAGKWGFTQYLSHFTGYARFYGSLALIPLFLLWVYITWMIVLFGLQVSYILQHIGHDEASKARTPDDGPRVIEPAMVLAIGTSLVRRFCDGKPACIEDLAQDTGLPNGICARMVEVLRRDGLLHEVTDQANAYCLAKPPEGIPAVAMLHAAESLSGYEAPVQVKQMRQAAAATLGESTLADVAKGTSA